eukprot:746500-Rhodomonas_salina.2
MAAADCGGKTREPLVFQLIVHAAGGLTLSRILHFSTSPVTRKVLKKLEGSLMVAKADRDAFSARRII